MTPTTTNNNSKQWTTYINTGLLTLIGSVLLSVWTNVNEIKKDMAKITNEVTELKTKGDGMAARMRAVEDDVNDIQDTYIVDLMNWTSDNFVRKPNK
jgi:hypothetical protein